MVLFYRIVATAFYLWVGYYFLKYVWTTSIDPSIAVTTFAKRFFSEAERIEDRFTVTWNGAMLRYDQKVGYPRLWMYKPPQTDGSVRMHSLYGIDILTITNVSGKASTIMAFEVHAFTESGEWETVETFDPKEGNLGFLGKNKENLYDLVKIDFDIPSLHDLVYNQRISLSDGESVRVMIPSQFIKDSLSEPQKYRIRLWDSAYRESTHEWISPASDMPRKGSNALKFRGKVISFTEEEFEKMFPK